MHKNKCLNEIVVICLRTISVWRWPAAIVIQKYSYYYSLLCFIIITSIIRFLCSRVHLYFLIFIFLILYLLFMYRILSLWWINYHYHSFNCCCWCCCCCYLLPPTKEEVYVFACVRLSVCLSVWAKLLKNACIDLDEVLHVDRCWDMDELINFWARSGLYFWCRNLLCRENPTYRCWYTYSWLLRCVVLKWFYSLRAVGTTLSEVNALHRVPF